MESDPRVGTELAGYRLEKLLGRGGMADVYRAVDSRLGRQVALKLLAPDVAGDVRFRERFLRESQLAASLDHPNVIPIYEAGAVGDLLFIAMRYVAGTDLKKVLDHEGRLHPRRAIALLARVADALDTAHGRGLVHRDVKPGNVLIAVDRNADPPEHPYLADFGLTKQTSSDSGLTQTGQFVGTADYAAPEQITRAPIGPGTDQYALACVLFECLTGAPPYRDDALMAVLWAHVNEAPPSAAERNPDLPKAIDPVLARGLATKPSDRYESCRALVAAARDALGVSGELPQSGARKQLLTRRQLLVGAGALVAAAAAVPSVVLTRGGNAAPSLAPRNSVVRIDPAAGEVAEIFPELAPTWTFAVGGGAAWMLSRQARTLTRIDQATGEVSSAGLPGLPYWIAATDDAVWATMSFEGSGYLLEIDPLTARVANRYRLPYSDPLGVAAVGDSTWVVGYDFLRGGSVIQSYPRRPQPDEEGIATPMSEIRHEHSPWWTTITTWFAVTDHDVWLLTGRPAQATAPPTLRRFDVKTGENTLSSESEAPEAIAIGPESAFVTQAVQPVVYEASLDGGALIRHDGWVTLDTGPILYAHGSLWIGDLLKNELRRIDLPTGQETERLQLAEPQEATKAGAPYTGFATAPFFTGLAADADSVWALVGDVPGNVI